MSDDNWADAMFATDADIAQGHRDNLVRHDAHMARLRDSGLSYQQMAEAEGVIWLVQDVSLHADPADRLVSLWRKTLDGQHTLSVWLRDLRLI